MKNLKVEKALRAIAAKHHGLLSPEVVVEEAKNPRHPLHHKFTWDDGEAAHNYRIWEARQLIRVVVEVLANGVEASPVFVSLSTDRGSGQGYRLSCDVLSDAEMRDQLLKDALHELNLFQRKYQQLKELASVFAAIRKTRKAA